MKSAVLYPYSAPPARPWCRPCSRLHAKHVAYLCAVYAIHTSILVVLLYIWRLDVNAKKYSDLEDVYYGVQIANMAIISTQVFMVALSALLFYAIYKENSPLVVPWIIGCITFMALESMAMVYSNVLRDHVNKQFDSLCKAEVMFFVMRALINMVAIWGVMRFYHLLKSGMSWKGPEAIEL
ncbi:uncharacterized protein LOC143915744 [Arctopsyche grandis]|uniref:uncharacterized protein LOC143915744 n=1 Tax=Arctopsyche grandis TaxID=121162 RepID=UPI00406DA4D4